MYALLLFYIYTHPAKPTKREGGEGRGEGWDREGGRKEEGEGGREGTRGAMEREGEGGE